MFGLLVVDGTTWWFVVALALAALLLGQIQTAGAILVEEVGFRRYRSRDLLLLGLWSLLELFWYRPLTWSGASGRWSCCSSAAGRSGERFREAPPSAR